MGNHEQKGFKGRISEELCTRVNELLKTPHWRTEKLIHRPAGSVVFHEVARDLPEPDAAREIRISTWEAELQTRKSVLESANPQKRYVIEQDGHGKTPTHLPALFEETENGLAKRMFAGETLTLAQAGVQETDDSVQIPVYPINYSEWIACKNPDFSRAYREEGLPLPYAGIGVSVLMETTDGFIPLTRRGIETPVYPGRLYSPGGGPKPGQNSSDALLEEIVEETGLQDLQHFDRFDTQILALIADTHLEGSAHSRPELVAYLPLTIPYRSVEQIQYERVKQKGRETDVWTLEPMSKFEHNFANKLVFGGPEMCPPTEAGLTHVLLYKKAQVAGLESALDDIAPLVKRMNSYGRVAYTPLIMAFSSE